MKKSQTKIVTFSVVIRDIQLLVNETMRCQGIPQGLRHFDKIL